jgi:hypothetical protein
MTEQEKKIDGDVRETMRAYGLGGRHIESALKVSWLNGYQARCEERLKEIMEGE